MLVILYLLGETISVYLMPCWLLLIWVGYQAKRRADAKALPLTQASDAV